jgi:hypothetical protein
MSTYRIGQNKNSFLWKEKAITIKPNYVPMNSHNTN